MAKVGNLLSVGVFTDAEMEEIETAHNKSGKSWNEYIMGLIRVEGSDKLRKSRTTA